MQRVLILTDGKAGHENQSKALARLLGCAFDVCEVQFRSRFCKSLSYLLDRAGVRLTRFFVGADGAPLDVREWAERGYRAVIGTGSGTFYAAKAFARRMGLPCAVVLYPRGYQLSSFDCILAPSFDRPKPAANVVEIPVNLVASDADFYARGVADFRAHYAKTVGRPPADRPKAVAVIVGGPNKRSTMTPEWMREKLDAIFADGADRGVEFWVTTSRRTPPEVEAVVDSYPWTYRLLFSRDHFNPIPAFVSLAERLCVTAESTGMLSEACTFGSAEVVALDNLMPGPHKFRRFVDDLTAAGFIGGTRKVDLAEPVGRVRARLGL